MKQGKGIMLGVAALLVLTMLGACSSTKMVTRWAAEDYQGPKLKKVLVIGIHKDDLIRRHFEDEFVAEIERLGRQGVASYVYMPSLEEYQERDKLHAVVKKVGADAVLVTTLKAVDKEKEYVPPRTDWVPGVPVGYGYYGYYYQAMRPVYTPGYTRTKTVVRLETRVFSVAEEKMVWAGNTESFNPSSSSKVIREIAKLVVEEMQSAGLID